MRNQWRFLLLRYHPRSQHHISRHSHFQVNSSPNFRSFSSLLHSRAPHVLPPSLNPQIQNPKTNIFRCFSSSELAVEHKDSDQVVLLTDVFSKQPKTNDEIKLELESNSIVISHDLVLNVLENLNTAPDVARRFFDWVSEVESERLSSKSYNLMLGILGFNGLVKEFWELVSIMKKKGYGVSRGTYIRVSEKFEKEGMEGALEKLKELFRPVSMVNSVGKICSRVCKVIRQEVWGDEVEKRLRELNVVYSSELVEMVLENLESEPNKGLIFFRWIEETGLFKHDEQTYNAMARMLGREDHIEKFWRVVDEMRGYGYEMETRTYVKVLGRFIKSKIKDAVDLYEFVMGGVHKPSVHECTFLLRKIVVSKELDMDLFSRVVRVYKESGNVLTNSTLDAVLKALTSVERYKECNKILKAMEEGGFVINDTLQSKIAFQLSSGDGKTDEASEFIDCMKASACSASYKTWVSLVDGYCVAGHLDKASDCFEKMIEKEEASFAGYPLELLVTAYCRKSRAIDASKLLSNLVNEKGFKPWHTTYKVLISKMLVQGGFKDALNLLGLMKSQGYPPFLDPFVEYISKTGTSDDAVVFLKAMTVKRFPSTSVFIRVFEAYLKAGRRTEAQDFLSKCPGYIRNHADVLNLFCSMKYSGEPAAATIVAS